MDNKVKMKVISTDSIKMKLNESEKINLDINVGGKEVDPIFRNSPAYNITNADITYWNNKSNFSGNYQDLTNKPIIPTRTSQLSNDSGYITKAVSNLENYTLSNNLSEVATTGLYNDLLDKPTIPTDTSDLTNNAGFVTSDTSDLENYTLTSNLATVATTGEYSDLLNTPELANVATSGQYSDLLNKPTLATVASTGDYDDLIDKPTIPSLTSDLTNDSGFITNTVNDLTNYTLTSNLATVATSGDYNDLINKPSGLTLDSSVSTTSTNGIENQAITNYVNTKGIYESGSNTNGYYIKYDDGTMICSNRVSQVKNINGQFESSYFTSIDTVNFPQEFISEPYVTATLEQNGALLGFTFTSIDTTSFGGYIWKQQAKNNVTFYIHYIAIGRWK